MFRYCVSPETLKTSESMSEFWTIISTNHDDNGTEFVSLFESKKYPIWGSQFHPEKNQVCNNVIQKFVSTLHACKMKKSTFLLSSSNGPWNMMKSRMSSQPSTFPSTSLISSSSSAERTDIDLRIEQMKRSISSTITCQLTLGKKLMQIIPCNNATFSSLNWNVLGT